VTGTVTVAGTTAAGNQVDVLATNTDTSFATTSASTVAGADGSFSLTMSVSGGTTVLSIAATSADGATAHATRTVVYDFVPGTKLLDVTDPSDDDNGPGNYAYPTASDFKPGAFDLQDFQVYDDGTDIIFRVQTRDLTPTFGSPLGAQLVDVYVHDPSAPAADTSTAASFPGRNYSIGTAGAWSRLIEVQGFGQRYIDGHGTTLGTVAIHANQASRYITFSVPKAGFGQPGSGWGFTVVITGQDGYSPDQARGFQATPQPYQFGVCAASSSDPHCTVDPGSVPKAIDVLVPGGVAQATELDYTLGPVVLQPVVMP
jgi:carbohydrate-binding DOMON domain-containing protein